MKYFLSFLFLCSSFTCIEAQAQKQQTYQIMLYYSPQCPYSKKVLAYLERSGIKIPMKNVKADPAAKEELQQQGGHLVVPCLIVNGEPIYDANNIIDWLSAHQEDLSKSSA
jgi:glutaredoxin